MSHATITTITSKIAAIEIENAILGADGVIVEGAENPGAWFAATIALEKYGKPVVLIAEGGSAIFGAALNHPMLKIVAPTDDRSTIDAFFAKHFPAPVDPGCESDVCRV